MTEERLALAVPSLTGLERDNVLDAVDSTWISSNGRYLAEFETRFAEVAETQEALAVTSGTVALHLALLALDAGPGDEVIVPSLTYIATANAVRYVGATPVFVDVDRRTWCLDPDHVAASVNSKTVGIIAVDLYGHPADYERLEHIADKHGLWLLEDAAEAPFATYMGRAAGSFGTASTFSFYGNKVLTSGEGGAIGVSDPDLGARMRLIRGQGMDPDRRYFFPVIGHNFRLTNVAAAILCAQLQRAPELLASRRQVFHWYDEALGDVTGLAHQQVSTDVSLSPWLYSVLVTDSFPLSRDELADELESSGIETRPFFIPIHTLPPYQDSAHLDLPVTTLLGAQGLNLPTHPGITESDVNRVVAGIRRAAGGI